MKKSYQSPDLALFYLMDEDILTVSSRENEDDDVSINGKFGDFLIFH